MWGAAPYIYSIFQISIFGQKSGNIRGKPLDFKFLQAVEKNIRARDFSPPPPSERNASRTLLNETFFYFFRTKVIQNFYSYIGHIIMTTIL